MHDSNMKAGEMVLDFLETLLTLALIIFCIFYFIVGDNFDVAQKIAKAAFTFSWVGVIFMLKLKFARIHYKKLLTEDRTEEIVAYYNDNDRLKDLAIIIIAPIFVISLAFWKNFPEIIDILQAFLVLVIMYTSHYVLFQKKDDVSRLMYATNADKLKDEVLTFFLPLFIVIIAFLNGVVDNVDVSQAIAVFVVAYFRHLKILFSGENIDL